MADIEQARRRLTETILGGSGVAPHQIRAGAFNNAGLKGVLATLANKVTTSSYSVTDEDIQAVKTAGLNEEQIFELIVCAAIGQATRQYETALTALADAVKQE